MFRVGMPMPQSSPEQQQQQQQMPPARDDNLPAGECRYILLHPELAGQRCACVGFDLNTAVAGSSCACGHLACYHEPQRREAMLLTPSDRVELDLLRQRVTALEDDPRTHDAGRRTPSDHIELDRLRQRVVALEDELERERSTVTVLTRLAQVEEVVETHKSDADTEMKSVYRSVHGVWEKLGHLQKQLRGYEERCEMLEDSQDAVQNDLQTIRTRVIELDDAAMQMEERIEALSPTSLVAPEPSASQAPSAGDGIPAAIVPSAADAQTPGASSDSVSSPTVDDVAATTTATAHAPRVPADVPLETTATNSISQSWTVHVSLLPTASQPFPFEKDTIAYKRCLSRGLHRVVAIPAPTAASFVTTISAAFVDLLQGRSWMPLVAKICDAQQLRGLPMLRRLEHQMMRPERYNAEFLRRYCATLDANGKIADLYIAMQDDVLRWADLRCAPPFLSGLEGCWAFDPLLDRDDIKVLQDVVVDHAPHGRTVTQSATHGVPLAAAWSWSPSHAAAPTTPATIASHGATTRLKRAASDISRRSSFGSADGDSVRPPKVARSCPAHGAVVEYMGRRAEAV